MHGTVFEGNIAERSLAEVIDATVDPFLAFHRSAPAFEALFLAAAVSPELASRIQVLHDTVASRIVKMFSQRAHQTKKKDLLWAAETAVGIVRGVLPLITPLKGNKRNRAIAELKTVLRRYLDPIVQTQTN